MGCWSHPGGRSRTFIPGWLSPVTPDLYFLRRVPFLGPNSPVLLPSHPNFTENQCVMFTEVVVPKGFLLTGWLALQTLRLFRVASTPVFFCFLWCNIVSSFSFLTTGWNKFVIFLGENFLFPAYLWSYLCLITTQTSQHSWPDAGQIGVNMEFPAVNQTSFSWNTTQAGTEGWLFPQATPSINNVLSHIKNRKKKKKKLSFLGLVGRCVICISWGLPWWLRCNLFRCFYHRVNIKAQHDSIVQKGKGIKEKRVLPRSTTQVWVRYWRK